MEDTHWITGLSLQKCLEIAGSVWISRIKIGLEYDIKANV